MRLLLVMLLLCSVALAEEAPLVTAPQVPLGADGGPNWQFAPQVTGFRLVSTGALAQEQASAQVCYDAKALTVRFRCPVADAAKLKGEKRARDGAVWQDDSVELLLDPGQTKSHFYHFIVNCRGSQYDSHDADETWNGDWTCAVQIAPREWTCVITIPFSALGRETPKPGEKWGVNFCADVAQDKEYSGWAFTQGKFEKPAEFGALVFQPDAPAVKLEALTNMLVGINEIMLSVASPRPIVMKTKAKISNAERTPLNLEIAVNQPAGGEQPAGFPFDAPVSGQYDAEVRALNADGSLLYLAQAPISIRTPVMLNVRPFLFAGVIEATIDATVLPQPGEKLHADVIAVGTRNRPICSAKFDTLPGRKGVANLEVHDVYGTIHLYAEVFDERGERVATAGNTVVRPEKPAWFDTKAGLTDKVLKPFEPLRVQGDIAEIWGRKLDYRGGLLPASIISQEKELLAGPIDFTLVSGGKTVDLKLPAQAGASSSLAASRKGEEAVGGIVVSGEQVLEYDGCIKFSVEFAPVQPLTVDALTFDIPLRPEVAKYLHTCKINWADTQSEAIPPTGWKHPFMPYVWVGDEDRGLAWFTETDETFSNKDPNAVLEIAPDGGRTVLRVHVIDKTTELKAPLKLVFGLQPTPVKPVPAKKPRVWHGAYYGMETQSISRPGCVQYPATGNLDPRKGCLEIVATLDFDPAEVAKQHKNQTLFHLRQANNDQVFFFYDYEALGMWFYLGEGEGYPQKYPIHITTYNLGWKKGETHHFALNWSDKTVMYLDGKPAVTSAPHDGWMSGPLDAAKLSLGTDVPGDEARWIINAVRVSSAPRTEQELAADAALVKDKQALARMPADGTTLLLDHPHALGVALTLPPPDKITAGQRALVGDATPTSTGVRGSTGEQTAFLDLLKQRGVDVVVYHDTWTQWYGYPSTIYGDKLKSLTKACHDRGMKLILYFGYGLSGPTPEMKSYHDEWTVWPLIPWSGGKPERNFDAGCNQSQMPQFLLDGIDKLSTEFDIDGVYLDGTTEPFGCINHYHGCGYLRDGTWHPTYPIWANRDFIRRMVTIFHEKRADPLVDVHMSANLTIPTLAFVDSYWDGEQFEGYLHGKQDPRGLLPLDSFRAEFMGRQFGLRPEFLVYEGRPFTDDEALSVTLLHNVLVRATGAGEKLEELSAIWKAMDDFGVESAEFLPYWNNGEQLAASPAGVYVSAYRRDKLGLLLVVSNLGKTEADGVVRLRADKLGLGAGALKASDAITKTPVDLERGQEAGTWTLRAHLGPMQWKLIRVTGEGR